MRYVVFDVETDGLLPDVTKVHCVTFMDASTEEVMKSFTPDNIDSSKDYLLSLLNDKNTTLVAHNAGYDFGVYYKLYGIDILKYANKVIDTMSLTTLVYPEHKLHVNHTINRNIPDELKKKYMTSYSLKAWGLRLGVLKGDYGEEEDAWSNYTKEMLEYNIQDCVVTAKVLKYILRRKKFNMYLPSKSVIAIEVYNSFIASIQTIHGWVVDVGKLKALNTKLKIKVSQIDLKLSNSFTPYYKKVKEVNTKRNSSMYLQVSTDTPRSVMKSFIYPIAYTKSGKPKKPSKKALNNFIYDEDDKVFKRRVNIAYVGTRSDIELVEFKAGSRKSILEFMRLKYNYQPKERTDTLSHKLDADTFSKLKYKEATLLVDRFKTNKLVSETETLLKHIKGNKIHHSLRTLGASSTHRMSANSP